VLGFATIDVEISAGDRSRDEKGSGFDAVRVDTMTRTVEFRDALNANGSSACSFDLRSHGDEQGSEIGDFGLAGAVLEDGLSLGKRGGHQEVFGSGNSDFVEDDVCALEPVGAGFEITMILGDGGSHGFEAVDVEVDGAAADGAASGHGDPCDAGACNERAEDQ